MSESKKNDEWNFSLDQDTVKKAKKKKARSKSVDHQKLERKEEKENYKKVLPGVMGVEEARGKRPSRTALAKKAEEEKRIESLRYPKPIDRALATIVDYSILVMVYYANQIALPTYKKEYMKYLVENKIDQTLPPEVLNQYLVGIPSLIIGAIIFLFPLLIGGRTWGKKFFNLELVGRDLKNPPARGLIFLRELIAKPVSVISVIGVLLLFKTKKRQALHDLICQTVVV